MDIDEIRVSVRCGLGVSLRLSRGLWLIIVNTAVGFDNYRLIAVLLVVVATVMARVAVAPLGLLAARRMMSCPSTLGLATLGS